MRSNSEAFKAASNADDQVSMYIILKVSMGIFPGVEGAERVSQYYEEEV